MMKVQHSFLATLLITGLMAVNLSAQTGFLKVTVDPSQMFNPTCNLGGATLVYLHSGLCSSNASDCAQVSGSSSPIWQHIAGHWGDDDGVGLMTANGDGTFSITIDIEGYYSNSANLAQDAVGPYAPGTPYYSMGVVFRNEDGSVEGKDNLCTDIFILGLDGATPSAVAGDNTAFAAVTAEWVASAGIDDPVAFGSLDIAPNPFSGQVSLQFLVKAKMADAQVEIRNALGAEVAMLQAGDLMPGMETLTWDGALGDGSPAPAGVYFCVIKSGQFQVARKLVKL